MSFNLNNKSEPESYGNNRESRRKVTAGVNDLQKCFPEVAIDWDFEKNGVLKPNEVLAGSGKKVFWKCHKCGYSWESRIVDRKNGNGCASCSKKKRKKSINSLSALNPGLADEWYFPANKGTTPADVTPYTHLKVYWKCKEKGHIWNDSVSHRSEGRRCPYCYGYKVIFGENDLFSQRPEVAELWNISKNCGLLPENVRVTAGITVWWKCNHGHEWNARVCDMTTKNIGCPYCSGKKPILGETDLATLAPNLVIQWNHNKNINLPQQYTKCSNKVVWWKCDKGHEWRAMINNRIKGKGCPYCSGKKPIKGETDLATKRAEIAIEWNYERNREIDENGDLIILNPDNFTIYSNRKVWWKCSNGHEWNTMICNRSKGHSCPECNKIRKTIFPKFLE